MVFSSPIFLFCFLPLFLALYALVFAPTRFLAAGRTRRAGYTASNGFILLSSLLFYFWGENWLILVMLASMTIDYISGQVIGRSERPPVRRLFLVVSIVANLSLLGFFKYANFGIETITGLAGLVGLGQGPVREALHVSLPLGISFYTFQSMSYTIDVYRRQVQPTRNFLDFACYVTMFPQLVAGPIVRYRDVAAELRHRVVTAGDFSYGCIRFTQGLAKKVLIANTIAVPTDRIFALPEGEVTTAVAWLGVLGYSLQIYFDFSGYSDMAIGLGRMLGFRFPENFNYPYVSGSIQEFWRRWHISLSTWFRDYLYIPLGGGRVSRARVYFNLVTVFFLCGLWHGASFGFILFGLLHGLFLVLERMGLAARLARWPMLLRLVYVHLAVDLGWLFFRATSLGQAAVFLKAMVGLAPHSGGLPAGGLITSEVALAFLLGSAFSLPLLPLLLRGRDRILARWSGWLPALVWGGLRNVVLAAVLLLAVMSLAGGSYNPFIYFRF